MLSGCSTAPIAGTARYASRCSWLFHMNVPTRSSPVTPSPRRAWASWAARRPTSAYVAERTPSPVQVSTSADPCTRGAVADERGDRERGLLHRAAHPRTSSVGPSILTVSEPGGKTPAAPGVTRSAQAHGVACRWPGGDRAGQPSVVGRAVRRGRPRLWRSHARAAATSVARPARHRLHTTGPRGRVPRPCRRGPHRLPGRGCDRHPARGRVRGGQGGRRRRRAPDRPPGPPHRHPGGLCHADPRGPALPRFPDRPARPSRHQRERPVPVRDPRPARVRRRRGRPDRCGVLEARDLR